MSTEYYIKDWGIRVRGYESAMGGLYRSELIALEVSEGVGPCHALVRFADVYAAYEALEHILRYDAAGLGAIGESLAISALRHSRRAAELGAHDVKQLEAAKGQS